MHSFRTITAASALALLAASAIPTARADVKIVSLLVSSGELAGGAKATTTAPATVTNYFKGKLMRVESPGSIIITDYANDKTFMLDPVKKTYYVFSMKNALAGVADNPMLAMLRITPTVYFHPGGQTKTIAGKTAQNYKYQATLRISLGEGSGAPVGTSEMFPTVVMSGEIWATEQIADSEAQKKALFPYAQNLPPFIAGGFKSLTDKLAEVKGLTLSSTQVITMTVSPGSPLAASLPSKPLTMTSTGVSVSEEPLADSLFTTEGYTEVPAPTPQLPAGLGVGGQPLGAGA